MSPAGEWKARFDPRFTSRGVFYLDEQRMVDVEVMEDAKHPLSLFIDNELEAQVKYSLLTQSEQFTTPFPLSFHSGSPLNFFVTHILFLCAGSEISIYEVHEPFGGHAAVQPSECGFTLFQAEYLTPVESHAKGEGSSS